MSEEVKKPKQYLPLLDEVGMACMRHLMPSMQFVEVEGMMMSDNNAYQVLVNPLPVPKEENQIVPESSDG